LLPVVGGEVIGAVRRRYGISKEFQVRDLRGNGALGPEFCDRFLKGFNDVVISCESGVCGLWWKQVRRNREGDLRVLWREIRSKVKVQDNRKVVTNGLV
jgi:hypothetical protein